MTDRIDLGHGPHQPPQEDRCASCGGPIPERTADGAKAWWGGPGAVVIVAWTCSPFCATSYERKNR